MVGRLLGLAVPERTKKVSVSVTTFNSQLLLTMHRKLITHARLITATPALQRSRTSVDTFRTPRDFVQLIQLFQLGRLLLQLFRLFLLNATLFLFTLFLFALLATGLFLLVLAARLCWGAGRSNCVAIGSALILREKRKGNIKS
jgi:hypothetical protein